MNENFLQSYPWKSLHCMTMFMLILIWHYYSVIKKGKCINNLAIKLHFAMWLCRKTKEEKKIYYWNSVKSGNSDLREQKTSQASPLLHLLLPKFYPILGHVHPPSKHRLLVRWDAHSTLPDIPSPLPAIIKIFFPF